MRPIHALPLLALMLAAGAPRVAAQGVDTTAVKAAIAATRDSYMRLYAAGDASGLAGHYATNAVVDLFGAPRMKGRAQIEAGIKAGFGMQKPVSLQINPVRTLPASGSLASEIGTYHQTDNANGKTVHTWGRFVISIGKDSTGAWRLNYLMSFPDSTRTDK